MIYTNIDELSIVLKQINTISLESWKRDVPICIASISRLLRLEELFGQVRQKEDADYKVAHYSDAVYFGHHDFGFCIAYSENIPSTGILIKFSASAYSEYQSMYQQIFGEGTGANEIMKKLQNIEGWESKCSRIDICIDYVDEDINISDLYDSLIEKNILVKYKSGRINTSKIRCFKTADETDTIFIGASRTRNTRVSLRIYDKKKEQLKKGGKARKRDTAISCNNWVRFEAEYHESYARDIGYALAESRNENVNNILIEAFLNRYQFIDTETNELSPFLKKLTEAQTDNQFTFSARKESNPKLQDTFGYLVTGSGLFSFVYTINVIWGQSGIDMIRNLFEEEFKKYKPNRKTLDFIKRNKDFLKHRKPPFGN